jgi:hypothetical protein
MAGPTVIGTVFVFKNSNKNEAWTRAGIDGHILQE